MSSVLVTLFGQVVSAELRNGTHYRRPDQLPLRTLTRHLAPPVDPPTRPEDVPCSPQSME